MKQTKRIMAFLLALLLTVTMLPMSVFAAENPTFTVSSASKKAGEEVTLSVDVSNNPGFMASTWTVSYDTTRLEKIEYTSATIDGVTISNQNDNFLWENTDMKNIQYNGKVLDLKFKVKEDAPAGDAEVTITELLVGDDNGDPVNFNVVAGKVTVAEKPETLIPFTKANHTDSGAPIHDKYSGIVGLKVEGIKVADWTEWVQGFNYQQQSITIYVNAEDKDKAVTLKLLLVEGQAASGPLVDNPATATVQLNNGVGSYTANRIWIGTGGLAPQLNLTITFKHAPCETHTWVEATCTAPKTCTVCATTEGEALGHTWNEGTVTTEPTCTSTGVKSFECTVEGCDGTKTETIAALVHQFVDGTCKDCGTAIPFTIKNGDTTLVPTQKESINCASAGTDVAVFDVIVPADATSIDFSGEKFYLYSISDDGTHTTLVSNKTSATVDLTNGLPKLCYRDRGSKTYYHINLIECTSHVWADADCDTPKTCSVCGATEGEALGHSWVDADCDTPKTCSVCSETEGEALGHDMGEATCTEPATCKRDGCGHTEGEALGHNMQETEAAVAPTCEEPGKTAVLTCANGCGHTEGGEEVPALGHAYEYKIVNEPTCTEEGKREITCANGCDYKAEESIEALGHDWSEWEVVKEASYTEKGSKERVCEVCDEKETKAIEKLIPTATEKVDGYDVAYQEGVVIVPEDSDVTVQDIKDALTDEVEKGDLKGEVVVTFMEATIGYIDDNNNFVPIDSNEYFKDGKTIDITLPYPKDGDADKNDNFEVYHYLDDGSIYECEIKDKTDGGLVITVKHLSPFVIAYENVDNTPNRPSLPDFPVFGRPSTGNGITIITPEDEKEEANPNTGAPVVCSFDLTAAGVVVLAATAAVLEIKRRK